MANDERVATFPTRLLPPRSAVLIPTPMKAALCTLAKWVARDRRTQYASDEHRLTGGLRTREAILRPGVRPAVRK